MISDVVWINNENIQIWKLRESTEKSKNKLIFLLELISIVLICWLQEQQFKFGTSLKLISYHLIYDELYFIMQKTILETFNGSLKNIMRPIGKVFILILK